MHTLSNNRNNAIGPWYVNSNNGPSNANANNWGGRTPTQGGFCTHEWAHYPSGHHAVERGGWRIDGDRILPSRKVTIHIERLMEKKWSELDYHQMLALASLYGYIKNSDAQGLKRRWRDGKYSQIFKTLGITAKEAEGGVIIVNPKQEGVQK